MIDIVMLCYEFTDKTAKAIESVLRNTPECNLILVHKKQSVALNRNEWMRRKLSDWYVMADDDIEVLPGWLETLQSEVKDGVGIVTMDMRRPDGSKFGSEQCHKEGEIGSACGALMLMRNIGVLTDENFIGSQWEDTDICLQYKEKGYSIISTHKAYFIHHTQGIQADNQHNRIYFENKWK